MAQRQLSWSTPLLLFVRYFDCPIAANTQRETNLQFFLWYLKCPKPFQLSSTLVSESEWLWFHSIWFYCMLDVALIWIWITYSNSYNEKKCFCANKLQFNWLFLHHLEHHTDHGRPCFIHLGRGNRPHIKLSPSCSFSGLTIALLFDIEFSISLNNGATRSPI